MPAARSTLLLMLVLLFALVVPAAIAAETEPNDSIAQASPIGIGYQQAELNATFATRSDKDYYAFATPAGRTYVIETFNIPAKPGDSATALALYTASGTEVAADLYGLRGTGVVDARITYTFTTAGTFYIAVSSYGSWTGVYSLRVLPKHDEPGAGWDAANDFEPNDTPETANELGVGFSHAQTHQLVPTTAFVTQGADRDWYRFRAEAGRTYVIETFNIQATSQNRATGLRLYNASGAELAEDSSGSRGTGDANARITYTFATAGTYYVRVTEGGSFTWAGTYSIRLLAKHDEPGAAWNAANDDEPNDDRPLARPIGIGADQAQTHQLVSITPFVSYDSDYDWYYFAAQAGHTYVIEVLSQPRLTTGLYLHSATGAKVADDEWGAKGGGSVGARISITIATSGTYYVLVKDRYYLDWSGTYVLRVCDGSCLRPLFVPIVLR